MKTIATVFLIAISSLRASISAQNPSEIVPKSPVETISDDLIISCKTKKVKTLTEYTQEEDGRKSILWFKSTFNNKGQILKTIEQNGYGMKHIYYTYSGDTMIIRSIAPYGGMTSVDDAMEVSIKKYNSKSQLLSECYGKCAVSDTMKIPGEFTNYKYENGHKISAVYVDITGVYNYDSHGNLIKWTDSNGKSETYRRVYDKDMLTEVYYINEKNPEIVFEKFSYNDMGLVSKYETFDSKGLLENTFNYKYNADKKIISTIRIIMNGKSSYDINENYTYNASGKLIKVETIDSDSGKLVSTYNYLYNAQGLPLNYIATYGSVKLKCVYTFWQ